VHMHAARGRHPTSAVDVLSAAALCLDLSLGGAAHTTVLLPLQGKLQMLGGTAVGQVYLLALTLTHVARSALNPSTLAWMSRRGCSFVAAPAGSVTPHIQPKHQAYSEA
jgi:hypothetical protein